MRRSIDERLCDKGEVRMRRTVENASKAIFWSVKYVWVRTWSISFAGVAYASLAGGLEDVGLTVLITKVK